MEAIRDRAVARGRLAVAQALASRPRSQLVMVGAIAGALLTLALAAGVGVIGPSSGDARSGVREVVLPRTASGRGSATATGATSAVSAAPSVPGAGRTPSATATVVVHAAGAVVRPGLVSLRGPVRVADVVAAAGGLTADADLDALNLAAPVEDGQRVFVPHRGAGAPAVADVDPAPPPNVVSGGRRGSGGPGGGASASGDDVVDINTATADQLEDLPGVGPATAAAIVEHRSRRGPFRSAEQLLDVPGIGPAKFAAMRDRVST